MTTKRTVWIIAAAAAIVGLMIVGATAAGARSGGVNGYSGNPTTGGDTCLQCHDQDATGSAAALTGPTTVAPGSTNTYTFTVTGGPAVQAGLDVSIDDGTLIASGAGTELNGGEITHSSPQAFSGGSASWSFQWTAPVAAGSYTMWGAGMSTNGSGTGGDAPTAAVNLPITVEAPNVAPTADAGGPYTALVGETINFDGSGSSDPDGSIVSYDWDFGDGNTGTGVSPAHAYAAAGLYTVSLTVTDNEGAADTATTTATISEAPTGDVDLDIKSFRVTKRVRLDNVRPVRIVLSVRNDGQVDEPRLATVVGMLGAVEVYRESLDVFDDVGDGSSRFAFPEYVPDMSGDIMWQATIEDDDIDEDMATALTTVIQPRERRFRAL
jgi:PKD repeat protein